MPLLLGYRGDPAATLVDRTVLAMLAAADAGEDGSAPWPYRLCNVIDLIGSSYGIVTMLVVLSFVLSKVQPRMSAKAVTILLFIIGSLLLVDGTLNLRTAIDRIWLTTRYGHWPGYWGWVKLLPA
jgi:hypothetical protein